MTRLISSAFVVFAALVAGCEGPELQQSSTSKSAPAPPAPEPVMVAGLPGEPLPEDDIPVTDVPRKVTPHDPVEGRRSRQAASDGYSLGIGTTAAAGFFAKQKMIYLSIDQANQLYWPQNDFKYPPKHEKFMKEVVELALNGVPLPKLAPGREYIYVPEMGAIGLMIRLTPGSPGSKLPPPEPGKEHIYDYKALAAAGVNVPGLQPNGTFDPDVAMAAAKNVEDPQGDGGPAPDAQPDAAAAAPAPTFPPAGGAVAAPAGDSGAAPAADQELSPNIRERAQQLGDQGNANAQGQ